MKKPAEAGVAGLSGNVRSFEPVRHIRLLHDSISEVTIVDVTGHDLYVVTPLPCFM